MATRRGDRTAAEILSAGRSVLLERGPDGLTIREVARRADLSPGALYNHFADKDALVAALAMQCVGTLGAYLGSVPDGPAVPRLKALGHAYARFAAEHPEEYAVIFDCLVNPPHAWEDYLTIARPFTLIVDACRQGLDDGSLADVSGVGPGGLAYALWSLADGHVHLRAKHLSAINGSFDRMFDAALNTLLRGLSAVPGSSAAQSYRPDPQELS